MEAKNGIAPEIFRQRLLIEGYYKRDITRELLSSFLVSIAEHLGLRPYAEPIIYSPATGMGNRENAGFDAFVPLIDSGISAYVWTQAKFISILFYTCKGFDEDRAVGYSKSTLALEEPVETKSF